MSTYTVLPNYARLLQHLAAPELGNWGPTQVRAVVLVATTVRRMQKVQHNQCAIVALGNSTSSQGILLGSVRCDAILLMCDILAMQY